MPCACDNQFCVLCLLLFDPTKTTNRSIEGKFFYLLFGWLKYGDEWTIVGLLKFTFSNSRSFDCLIKMAVAIYSSFLELLQPILLNTGFLWSLPLSKFLIEEKSKYQYCQWTPLAAIGFVVWGICISLFPTFIAIFQDKRMSLFFSSLIFFRYLSLFFLFSSYI